MQYLLLILFGLFIGCLVGGMLTFLFFLKKKVALKNDQIKDQKDYLEILQRHNKIEKELAEYKNEFHNKYVNDEYDAY